MPPPVFEQRTAAGALLRSGLDQIAQLPPLAPGKKGRAAIVTDGTGLGVGVAWVTPQGWRVDAHVSTAIKHGRALMAAVAVEW